MMSIQRHIRRILKEIDEDRVQIRLGRSADRHFGKVQNIIIQVDDNDITSQDDEPGLGKMNIVIKDNEIIVGDIFIPEKYRRQGIATKVYQKISDHFGLPIVSSKTKGFNQTMEGGYIWKDREKFEPRNIQESISRMLREDVSNRAKEKLNQILKSQGVVSASKAVGGFQKLSKVLNFDLNDMDTQEMLVKNFIYFDNTEEVNVNYLDIRTSANGGKVININGTTTGTAGNMDSWYINHICDKLNNFFPFRVQPAYHPVFAARGIRMFIDAELVFQEV